MEQFFINPPINFNHPQTDLEIIKENLNQFLKNQHQFKKYNLSTNIRDYNKISLSKALFSCRNFEKQEQEESIEEKIKNISGAEILGKLNSYIIIKITSSSAASILCKDSSWCVKYKETAENEYLNKGPLYYLIDLSKKKSDPERQILVHLYEDEFMNRDNDELELEKSKEILEHILRFTHPDIKYENNILECKFKDGVFPIKKIYPDIKILKAIDKPIWKGDLDLTRTKIEKLPDNLTVEGQLDLTNTPIVELPKNLKVTEYLTIVNTNITSIPDNTRVGVTIYLNQKVNFFGKQLRIGKSLLIYNLNSKIVFSPNTIIGGNLDLSNTKIESLPKNFTVDGILNLAQTPIETLPNKLTVGHSLILRDSKIKSLPIDLKVKKSISLGGTPIQKTKNFPKFLYINPRQIS